MSDTTKIEWADATFNPWIGCTKVSAGCAHCYAEARDARLTTGGKAAHWGHGAPRQRTSAETWRNPVRWDAAVEVQSSKFKAQGKLQTPNSKPETRPRVFPSLCDWLDEEVDIQWFTDFLRLVWSTPRLDWLLLTKRPEWFARRLKSAWLTAPPLVPFSDWLSAWYGGTPPANVWVGASVEDQATADRRLPALLQIPAPVRFLSVEPLLGPVNLDYIRPTTAQAMLGFQGIHHRSFHWVIVGGESGPQARACDVSWVRGVVRQCKEADVPVFVKQLGTRPYQSPESDGGTGFELPVSIPRAGTRRSGRRMCLCGSFQNAE